METNNAVLDVIISLLKGAKTEHRAIDCDYAGKHYTLWGCDYLLGQALRQYRIPDDHYLISAAAKRLWSELAKTQNIRDFHYKEPVKYEGDSLKQIDHFKGNSSKPDPDKLVLVPGKSFVYREVFHNEHVVPLKIIIEHLLNLDNIDYETVNEVLDHIYICRILKEEDRRIKEKSNRPFDAKEVISSIYKMAKIDVTW